MAAKTMVFPSDAHRALARRYCSNPGFGSSFASPAPVGSRTSLGGSVYRTVSACLPSGEKLDASPSPRRTAGDPSTPRVKTE